MRGFIVLIAAIICSAAPQTISLSPERIRGAVSSGAGSFFTWGDRLRQWSARDMTSRVIAEGPFGEGGCVADLDNDGQPEIISVRGKGLGKLLWMASNHPQPEVIDDEMEVHDCLAATLFGRRGVLVIQRGMQIRFYERVKSSQWRSRDIYSIYTPSYQTGLALADVDGDGLVDVFCGNYWVQSPKKWDESWRIFAINTWSEQQESAMMRIVGKPDGSGEYVAQGHSNPARFAFFERTPDPKQQWPPRFLAETLKLANVHGLTMFNARLLAGEHNGPASRLLSVDPKTGRFDIIATGHDILTILPMTPSLFITAGPYSVTAWKN